MDSRRPTRSCMRSKPPAADISKRSFAGFGRSLVLNVGQFVIGWCQTIVLLSAALLLQACITVHAPLLPDQDYPPDWGEISRLGPQCKDVEGTYSNLGTMTVTGGISQPVSLLEVLNLDEVANTVSLNTETRRLDGNGDAFITLRISAHGDATVVRERECFCIKQTLSCADVSEKYWSSPGVAVVGFQRNAYFAMSPDRTLVVKLQNYHAGVVLGAPIFGMKEPWARFKNAAQ